MKTSAPLPARNDPDSPAGESVTCWRLVILAVADDPLLLARAIQKLAVPEIELRAVQFETGGSGQAARLELVFAARGDRARLAAVRLRKIIGMQSVICAPCTPRPAGQQPSPGLRLPSSSS